MSDTLPTVMAELLDEIEAKAKAATTGPWVGRALENFGFNVVRYVNGDKFNIARVAKCSDEANARHIARMDPPTALALVAEVRRLRAENEGIAAIAKLMADNVLAVAEARRQALEDAAAIAERTVAGDDIIQKSAGCLTAGQRAAAAIRALMDKEPAR